MTVDDNKKELVLEGGEGVTEVSFGQVVYANQYYDVILLDEPVVLQPSYELAAYGIYNKMTAIVEIELCVLPAAIHTANNFSAALEAHFPPITVRDTLSVVGEIGDGGNTEDPQTH